MIKMTFLSLILLLAPATAYAVSDYVYKEDTYSIKEQYYQLSNSIKEGISFAEDALSAASFENSDAKKKVDTAWSVRWMAWESHGKVDSNLKYTELYLNNNQFKNAYDKLLQSDSNFYSIKEDLYAIKKELADAQSLEKQFQENNKSCFLFWCETRDTYNGVNQKIRDLDSKLKQIESDLLNLKTDQSKVTEKIHKYEIADKNLEIKKLESLRVQEKDQAEQEKQRLEKQKQQELQRQQYQSQMQLQEQQQQAEIQLQEQVEAKERQRIIEEARTNPVINGLIDGTLYFYIEQIPSSYYTVPGIHEGVEDIASSLERDFYGVEIRRTYNYNSADLVISWVKDFGSSKLGHATFKKFVEVGLGQNNCWGEWQPYNVDTVKKVMWHEIGHSLGHSHSNDPNNVMYYSTQPQFYKTVEQTIAVDPGSRWVSFCDSGSIMFAAKSSKDTDGFDAFAIPPDDPRGFSNNGGSVYLATDGKNCGAKNIVSLTRFCNIGNGAYLHFKNNESHTIYITFEMRDMNSGHWPEMSWDQNAFEYDSSYLYKVYNMFH